MSVSSAATQPLPLAPEIERRLVRASDLRPRLEHPNLPATRETAAVFQECLRSLSSHLDLGGISLQAVEHEALYRSFDAFLAFRAGEAALSALGLVDLWTSRALIELRPLPDLERIVRSLEEELEHVRNKTLSKLADAAQVSFDHQLHGFSEMTTEASVAPGDSTEWLVLYHQAVEQLVAPDLGAEQARMALRSLMTRLELSQDDLGRMVGVSGESVRRWERGATAIPAERRAGILAAESGLRRLQDLFRPERLATVIRRPAELFDGETALAWILRGRIGAVADRYETALLYQG